MRGVHSGRRGVGRGTNRGHVHAGVTTLAHFRGGRPRVAGGEQPKRFENNGERSRAFSVRPLAAGVGAEALNLAVREERVSMLTEQLKKDLLRTAALFQRPIFTTALIAGDVVILDAMYRCGLLDRVPVVFIDTLHLFNETLEFLEDCEARYGFKALRYLPEGCEDRKDWNAKYASDLYMTDVDRYDQLAKVEPLNRALTELEADAWINGRRRDHGFDRAFLDVYEEGGAQFKMNVLAHWTFRDCWDYIEHNGVPAHPLHQDGYPSIGDLQSTLPVPKEKWFEYAGERSGRWSGEGKTECGIHTFEKLREEED